MPQLTEGNRSKLDSIVQRMADAGEPDDAIQFVVSDFKSKYALPEKPVSAEDFAPPARDVSVGRVLWNAATSIPSAIVDTVKTAYNDQRPEDAALGPARVLAPVIRSMGGAHKATAEQALADAQAGRYSEAVGHGAAALLPGIGPAAAQAGEDIGSGDPERIERGGGNALALIGGAVAPAVVPPVASAAGRGAQAVGRGVATAARNPIVGEIAKTGVLEAAGHGVGLPPMVMTGARLLLEKSLKSARAAKAEAAVLEAAKAAKPSPNAGGRLVTAKAPTAEVAIADTLRNLDTADVPQAVELPPAAELPPGYEPRTSAPIIRAESPNTGGRLVKAKPPANEVAMADMLSELATEPPPARVTLPPQPDLPPGYTPRTTAPKPRAERPDYAKRPSERAPKPRPATTHGPKNYFMRKDAPSAVAERVEPRAMTVEDLPESWKSRTGQPLTKPSAVPKIDVDEVRSYLAESGLTAEEAIDALSRDRTLKTPDRIRLVEAINKTRFKRAQ